MPQITANGIPLEYAIHGEPGGEPLLAIMGLGSQMTRWPQAFVDTLTARGFRVILFDNRDVGLSHKFDHAGVPDMAAVIAAVQSGAPAPVAYTLQEMADDAAGLLEALHIPRAHIVGVSMGGMIAQLVAADHPERVLSLTSIMSTSGNPDLPRATPEAMAVITQRGPDPKTDFEGYLDHAVKGERAIGSPAYPADPALLRERTRANHARSYHPDGFTRHYAGIVASPDRREKLKTIAAPTVVVHGEADPLVPVEAGRDTAAHIPGAELVIIPGMGHDLPAALYETIADAIARAASRARATA